MCYMALNAEVKKQTKQTLRRLRASDTRRALNTRSVLSAGGWGGGGNQSAGSGKVEKVRSFAINWHLRVIGAMGEVAGSVSHRKVRHING